MGGKPADKQVANEPPAAAAETPGKSATKPKNEAPSAPAAQGNSAAAPAAADNAPAPQATAKDKDRPAAKNGNATSANEPKKAPASTNEAKKAPNANSAPAVQGPKAPKAPKGGSPAATPPGGSSPAGDGAKKPDAPKQGGHTPVNVCHATSSDSNPYVFITVDDDSVKAEGHLAHRNEPNKTWKSAGTFRGVAHAAGDPKRDLIGDYRDASGNLHQFGDGVIDEASDCADFTPPPPPPPVVVPPAGSFVPVCTPPATVQIKVGTLSSGSDNGGSFRLVSTTTTTTVTSGATVDVAPVSAVRLEFVAKSGEVTILQTGTSLDVCPTPPPPPGGELSKTSVPPSGSVVTAGQVIDYTVTVTNTGQEPITNAPVVDTLPSSVTVVSGSVVPAGSVSLDGRTITWTATLPVGGSATYKYQGLVTANASGELVNRVTFLGLQRTTTHTVGDRSLEVRKSVSAAVAEFGDELTYTLTVRALGSLGQTDVKVRDSIPAGTTYVPGSAACDASATCTTSFRSNEVTWELSPMAAGVTRTVTFTVLVDTPRTTAAEGIPGVAIRNVGLAFSKQVPPTPSNEVVTEVVAVGGVKTGPKGPGGSDGPGGGPGEGPNTDDDVSVAPTSSGPLLARTGGGLPFGAVLLFGGLLFLGGIALLRVGLPARSGGVS